MIYSFEGFPLKHCPGCDGNLQLENFRKNQKKPHASGLFEPYHRLCRRVGRRPLNDQEPRGATGLGL